MESKSAYILAVDTATNCGGVALGRDGEAIGQVMIKASLRYQERLVRLIDFLLGQHDLELAEIDCFAAAGGPGSFTGLRVGLATVKAFCQALGKPAVAVSSLRALAYRFRFVSGLVAPLIDARRRQVFAALYRAGDSHLEEVLPEAAVRPESWLKELPSQPCLFVGDGAQLYRTLILSSHSRARVAESDNTILAELCQLAWQSYREGKAVPAAEVRANYVRPPDVELRSVRR